MKLLLFLTVICLSSITFAEVKPPGTLVAYRCAQKVVSVQGIKDVCLSNKVGEQGDWLVLTLPGGRKPYVDYALPIKFISEGKEPGSIVITALIGGDMMLVFPGTGLKNEIKTLEGDRIRFHFSASDFQWVMHTQSIQD